MIWLSGGDGSLLSHSWDRPQIQERCEVHLMLECSHNKSQSLGNNCIKGEQEQIDRTCELYGGSVITALVENGRGVG